MARALQTAQIVGQPVFVPLYKLFLAYGKIFRLSFGPKNFVIISDPAMAKQVGRVRPTGWAHQIFWMINSRHVAGI